MKINVEELFTVIVWEHNDYDEWEQDMDYLVIGRDKALDLFRKLSGEETHYDNKEVYLYEMVVDGDLIKKGTQLMCAEYHDEEPEESDNDDMAASDGVDEGVLLEEEKKYVQKLRDKLGDDVATDPVLVGNVIEYKIMPDDITGYSVQVNTATGLSRRIGNGKGCFWTEWE